MRSDKDWNEWTDAEKEQWRVEADARAKAYREEQDRLFEEKRTTLIGQGVTQIEFDTYWYSDQTELEVINYDGDVTSFDLESFLWDAMTYQGVGDGIYIYNLEDSTFEYQRETDHAYDDYDDESYDDEWPDQNEEDEDDSEEDEEEVS